jgi:hypothetical protein
MRRGVRPHGGVREVAGIVAQVRMRPGDENALHGGAQLPYNCTCEGGSARVGPPMTGILAAGQSLGENRFCEGV